MDASGNMEETLQQWYGRQSARRVDLVGDYAGKELFLLEGDSLLLHCFGDATLDFKCKKLTATRFSISVFTRSLANVKRIQRGSSFCMQYTSSNDFCKDLFKGIVISM